jgi:hypothetical protein
MRGLLREPQAALFKQTQSGSSGPVTAPIFLRLTLYRWCCGVPDLEPVLDPTGAVRRAERFRHRKNRT